MKPAAPSRRVRAIWVGATAAAVLVGVLLMYTGVTPWAAPFAVLIALTLAIGQRTSWPFALAAAMIVEIALLALMLRFMPDSGLTLVGVASLMFAILGLVAVVATTRSGTLRLVGRRELRIVVPLLAVPTLALVLVGMTTVGTGDLEWAMHNDAVWNLVTTRMLIADGGLNAIAHPNASPLTPGLLAIAAAVGRDSVLPQNLLRHDVGAFAAFWLIATSTTALLGALIGARSVHGGARTLRVIAAAIVAAIPFTWFVFGFAAQFGFYNATLTLLLLLASWLAWLETRVTPVVGAAVLSLAAVALLATWAPVAAVPFALAVFALGSRAASLAREGFRLREVSLLVLAVLPVPIYIVAVTLPDLRREGAALAVDGGIMQLLPVHVAVIVVATLVVTVLTALHLHQRHPMNGLLIVLAVSAVVGAYLVAQRAGAAHWWGYYPAKFAWLISSMLIVILTAALLSELASTRGRRWTAIGVAAISVATPFVLMAQVPPTSDRIASVFTPIAIVTNTGVAAGNPAAQRLFDLAEPGVRTMALSYLSPSGDAFLNSWLLQLESTSSADPIRTYSYIMDPRNEAQACEAVRAWNAPVRIVSSDPAMPDRFRALCAGADLSFDLRDTAAPGGG